MRLKGKVAIVTGGASGMGKSEATIFAREGAQVVVADLLEKEGEETAKAIGPAARFMKLDVTSEDSWQSVIAGTEREFGRVDILVNNAGISVGGPVESVPIASAQAVFDTNVWGAARMVQAIAPGMRDRSRGWIVNVTSLAGRAVGPLNGYYSASTWALEALSEAMELELGHWGIRVIVIEPGLIDTPILLKENDFGIEVPPYDELARQWEAASAKLSGDGALPGPELVAGAIADSLEESEPHLRHPVGADAEMVVAARDSMGYEQFISTMREFLGIDW